MLSMKVSELGEKLLTFISPSLSSRLLKEECFEKSDRAS